MIMRSIIIIAIFALNFACCSSETYSNECDLMDLIPGLVKAAKAVDITGLNLFPMDNQMTSMNGFGNSVVRFTCNNPRNWSNPYLSNSKYFVPEEVERVNIEPYGQLVEFVSVHKSIDSLRNSLDISGSLDVNIDGAGQFSLSGGYKSSKEQILSGNYTIIDVTAFAAAVSIDFRPYAILKTIRGFSEMIEELKINFELDPSLYELFLDNYGTHYFSSVKLGGYMIMRTLVNSTYLEEGEGKEIFGNIAVDIENVGGFNIGADVAKNQSKMIFNENIRTNYYYYGGKNGITRGPMSSQDFKQWISSVQEAPWIYAGKLTPISCLIQNATIREQMKIAIQVKLDKAFLRDALETLKMIRKDKRQITETIIDCLNKVVPNRDVIIQIQKDLYDMIQNHFSSA